MCALCSGGTAWRAGIPGKEIKSGRVGGQTGLQNTQRLDEKIVYCHNQKHQVYKMCTMGSSARPGVQLAFVFLQVFAKALITMTVLKQHPRPHKKGARCAKNG